MSVARVVGMVVSFPESQKKYVEQNLEKTFLSFPDAKDWEGSLPIRMLMLVGYAPILNCWKGLRQESDEFYSLVHGRTSALFGREKLLDLRRCPYFLRLCRNVTDLKMAAHLGP